MIINKFEVREIFLKYLVIIKKNCLSQAYYALHGRFQEYFV